MTVLWRLLRRSSSTISRMKSRGRGGASVVMRGLYQSHPATIPEITPTHCHERTRYLSRYEAVSEGPERWGSSGSPRDNEEVVVLIVAIGGGFSTPSARRTSGMRLAWMTTTTAQPA